jgi:hypothetical protein
MIHEYHILRILREATEPLFPSQIVDRLSEETGTKGGYTMTEVVGRLTSLGDQVEQTRDGRWTLKGRGD